MPDTGLVETTDIYSSWNRGDCDERAFMLMAVGIPSAVGFDGGGFQLQVAVADAPAARSHLASYDTERRANPGPVLSAQTVHSHQAAWVASAIYVAVLFSVNVAISTGLWPADAFERGALNAARVHDGQWWRAWTALTLHTDASHLFGNLGAGVWFGTLAARQLGAGSAWLLVVTGAAAANLFDAWFGPATYRSVGASTAVFTALGLMAAHTWRTRHDPRQRWAQRWSPLVAGAVLLGWFGSSGEGTDLVAHALGFGAGCTLGAFGVAAAIPRGRVSQVLAGLAALGCVALAWILALKD